MSRIRIGTIFSAALLVAACGGRQTTSSATSQATLDVVPAAHYAELFEEGRTWTYAAETMDEFWDDEDPEADEYGMVSSTRTWQFTCRVVEVQRLPGAMAARVECDDDDAGLIDAIYGANGSGLYLLTDMPSTVADFADYAMGDPVIAATPELDEQEWEDEYGFGGARSIYQDQGGWCVSESYVGGDESSNTTCFAPGRGITMVDSAWAGGAISETVITLQE